MYEGQIPVPVTDTANKVIHADIDSQFDDLLSADNGVEVVRNIILASRKQQNTMTIGEFQRYEPLFRYSAVEELGQDMVLSLTEEYFSKICSFDPVTVIADNNTVLFTLPPIYNRTDAVNNAGFKASQIAQAFVNACQLPDEISHQKREKYLQWYRQVLDIAQNKDRLDHVREVSKEMTDVLMSAVEQNKQQITQSNLNDNNQSSSSVKDTNNVLPFGDDDELEPL